MEIEEEKFDSCLRHGKYVKDIQKYLEDGRSNGITGTPWFFTGNEEDGIIQ